MFTFLYTQGKTKTAHHVRSEQCCSLMMSLYQFALTGLHILARGEPVEPRVYMAHGELVEG